MVRLEAQVGALQATQVELRRELVESARTIARLEGRCEGFDAELGRMRTERPAFTGMDAARAAAGVDDEEPPAPGAVRLADLLERFGEIHGGGVSWDEMERRRGRNA